MRRLCLSLIATLIMFTGCTEDTTVTAPVEPEQFKIVTIELASDVKAYEESELTLNFTALVRDEEGAVAVGVPVELSLIAGEGSVSPERPVSDKDGMVEAELTLLVPLGKTTAKLLIKAGATVQTESIELIGLPRPATLLFTAADNDMYVLPGQNAETSLTCVVTDKNGVGIPGMEMSFNLSPVDPVDSTFGSLSLPEPTDKQGRMKITFNSGGGLGVVLVKCETERFTESDSALYGEILLSVNPLIDSPDNLSLFSPDFIRPIHPDSSLEVTIYASLIDANGNGIPNVQISMSTSLGTLSQAAPTDSTGLTSSRFNSNHQFGVAEITVWVEGTECVSTIYITIRSIYGDEPGLTLTSDVGYIYADNGRTVANITGFLSDENNQAILGAEIRFSATHGVVRPSIAVTDSSGIVRVIFTDIGLPSVDNEGNPVPAVITAVHTRSDEEASVEVTILEKILIEVIILHASRGRITAGSADSDSIGFRVTCFYTNGGLASGEPVYFYCDLGSFTEHIVILDRGNAETWFRPGRQPGTATIRAVVYPGEGEISSRPVEIEVVPGAPQTITLTADPERLRTNSSSTITAAVADTFGNPVGRGKLVTFETTLGNLNRLSALTDEDGQAVVLLYSRDTTGTAEISAVCGSATGRTSVEIEATALSRIEVTIDPPEVYAQRSTYILAEFFDHYNNYITTSQMVVFELLQEPPEPRGCNINSHGRIDSAQTSNGIATATINSGTEAGVKFIRVYTWADSARYDTISSPISRFQVLAGPAHYIDIDVSNEAEDVDGGCWAIEVSARVFDLWMSPVEDGIPVEFTCDSVAHIGPSWTGNESRNGSRERGVAYATMIYNSTATFDTITITASVREQGGRVTAEREHVLPLNDGSLALYVTPENWMIDYFETAYFQCVAVLTDGHEVLIDNAPILFTSTRGYFHWYNYVTNHYIPYRIHDIPPELAIKYTGWNINWGNAYAQYREQPGEATVYLIGEEDDFFLGDPMQEEASVTINAEVFGYEGVESDPRVVYVTRHP